MNRYTQLFERNRWDDFGAGVSALFLLATIITIVLAYGDKSVGIIDAGDVAFALFFLALFASAVIDLYKFFKRIK